MKRIKDLLIFLVDDDKMFQKSMERDIHQFFKNSNVVTFSTGEECLSHLYQKPDIILLDYLLNSDNPKAMDGIKVLNKVKIEDPEAAVIMLSGQDHIDIAVNTMKHGAFDYLVKNDHLFVRVHNAIKNVLNTYWLKDDIKEYKFKKKLFGLSIAAIIAVVIYLETHYHIFR